MTTVFFAGHEMAHRSMRQLVYFLGVPSVSGSAGIQIPNRWLACISTCKIMASTTFHGSIRPCESDWWYRGNVAFT